MLMENLPPCGLEASSFPFFLKPTDQVSEIKGGKDGRGEEREGVGERGTKKLLISNIVVQLPSLRIDSCYNLKVKHSQALQNSRGLSVQFIMLTSLEQNMIHFVLSLLENCTKNHIIYIINCRKYLNHNIAHQ